MPIPLRDILDWLAVTAPPDLAESWDNTGLLLGDEGASISSILTCLTLTPDVAREAIHSGTGLVVTHHPIFFRPVQKLTTGDSQGRMVLDLVRAGIAVYSPHTSWDNAALGINQQWADLLELTEVSPLRPCVTNPALGGGRWGKLRRPAALSELIQRIHNLSGQNVLSWTGNPETRIDTMGIACGSAGEFLRDAHTCGCQLFITGETRFHTQLEARELGVNLVLLGHFPSERRGLERLAELLAGRFPDVAVQASQSESDPAQWSLGK